MVGYTDFKNKPSVADKHGKRAMLLTWRKTMVKFNEEQLKQKAIEDWHSYVKQYDLPQWFRDNHWDRGDYERYAKQNNMSVSNFKKYMDYFCEYDRSMFVGR